MKFDLHMHTSRRSPDSVMDPVALVRRAREVGLDGVVITEHDCLWPEGELEELRAEAPGLVVLAGVEVSAREGHFLAYGVTDASAVPPGIRVAELCRVVHAQGGAVVAAHPFRWGQAFDEIVRDERPALDGIELMSKNMDADCRRRAAGLLPQHPWAGLGSSDAHHLDELGVCRSDFAATIRTNRDLVAAIRGRRVTVEDWRARNGGR
jgi:predicted metal-dependent phosphoesterase TrpH